MPEFGLGLRDDLVRLREFLDVVDAGADRIEVGLSSTDLEHVQDDLGIFRIVLVPAVMQSLPCSCESNGRDKPQIEARLKQSTCQRSVIIARRLETDEDGAAEQSDEVIMFRSRLGYDQPAAATLARHLDQDIMGILRTSMATNAASVGIGFMLVMVGLLQSGEPTPSL